MTEPTLAPVSGKLTAVTVSGGMFRASPDRLRPAGKPWDPLLEIDASRLAKPLCSLLPLPGERFAMTSGPDTTQIVMYDPKEQDRQFRRLLCPHEMSAGPGDFAGGLLTPCVNGQVCLLDPDTLGNMAKPWTPADKRAAGWKWKTPLAAGDKLAVLSDGDKRLTAIGISTGDGQGPDRNRDGDDEKQPGLADCRLGQGRIRRRTRCGRFDRQPIEL